jgi:hypothetical protein
MDSRHLAVRPKNKMASVGSSRNSCAAIAIPQQSLRNMPTDFAQYATVGKVKPSCSKIRRIWSTGFYIDGFTTIQYCRWTMALFLALIPTYSLVELFRYQLFCCKLDKSIVSENSHDFTKSHLPKNST